MRDTQSNQVAVVVLKGDLDIASAMEMRQRLQAPLDARETRLVIDLGGVTHVDSAGLGEVVRALKLARRAGGDVRLCGLRADVLRIFEVTGLTKAMAVYLSREEAIASWGNGRDLVNTNHTNPHDLKRAR